MARHFRKMRPTAPLSAAPGQVFLYGSLFFIGATILWHTNEGHALVYLGMQRSLLHLLDNSNSAAAQRATISGHVVANLSDARSASQQVQCRLADADPLVLSAVPA